MVNPADLMKIMSAKNKFESAHPKFVSFFTTIISQGINEGDIIEVTVTRANGTTVTGNMKVQQSDLDLFNELKNLN